MTARCPIVRIVLGLLAAVFFVSAHAIGGGLPTDAQIKAAAAAYFRVTYEENPDLLFEGLQISEGRVYKRHRLPPATPKGGVRMIDPMTGNFPEEDAKNWKLEDNWLADLVYRVRYTRTLPKGAPRALAEKLAVPAPRDSEWAFAYLLWSVSIRGGRRVEELEFHYSTKAVADGITAEKKILDSFKDGRLERGLVPGQQGDWILSLGDAPRPTGFPLCDGAINYFGSKIDPNRPTYIRATYDEILAGFRRALDSYEQKRGPAYVSLPEHDGWMDAGLFLFAHNPPKSTGLRFSFTQAADRSAVENAAANGNLWDGSFHPRRATEASLVTAIHRRWLEKQRQPLDPGDVLLLAMEETDGDARMAMLLAHNTLRAAGRGEGDTLLCGISPNTAFFRSHLKVLRGGGNPGENPSGRPDYWDDNEGVWYHIFGVGFYEMQNLGNGPTFQNWADMDAGEIQRQMAARLAAMGDDGVDWVNATSQVGEQVYRQWIGGQAPDPEKFCFNVWGTHAAHDLFRRLVDKRQVRAGKMGPGDPAPGSLPPGWEDKTRVSSSPQRTLQGAHENVGRVSGLFSPMSVTWEGGGQRMVFDQKNRTLTGSFPVRIAPFVEPDGTMGIVWLDLSTAPYTLTLRGAADGRAHFVQWEPGGAHRRGWVLPVKPGESYTLRVDPARPDAAMVAANGREWPSASVRASASKPTGAAATPRAPGASSPSPRGSAPAPAVNPTVTLFDNRNASVVFDGPDSPTRFALARRSRIAMVQTYHWNGARGARPGTIGLRDERGRVYGPWRAEGSPGQGGVAGAFWTVRPDVVLPPGTYSVVDSDPGSWSRNIGSGNAGFAVITGHEEGEAAAGPRLNEERRP